MQKDTETETAAVSSTCGADADADAENAEPGRPSAPVDRSAEHSDSSSSSDSSSDEDEQEDDEEMRAYRAQVLAMAMAALEVSDSDDEGDPRDADYARRSLALSMSHWDAATASAQQELADLPKLAIGMLVKTPRLSALKTFIQYHSFLGVSHFEFFFDDTVTRKTTTSAADEQSQVDSGGCNDAAVGLLEQSSSEFPGVKIVVHRCTLAFWERAKASSEIWAEFGGLIWKEVIARQSLALEVAVRTTTAAGAQWLIHIDGDEALSFGRTEIAAAAAGRFFASLPLELDQVTFLNHEAAPETDTADDWFREVKHFKTNPACGGQEPFVGEYRPAARRSVGLSSCAHTH
jgi:hypothetical protein